MRCCNGRMNVERRCAALFPAVLRPYRRMGFEIAGSYTTHRLALDAIAPDRDTLSVELVDVDRDLAAIREAYRGWVRSQNGPVEPVEDEHWRVRILTKPDDSAYRAVVVREADRVTGFAAFARDADPGPLDVAFGLSCNAFFTTTPAAQRALAAVFPGVPRAGQVGGMVRSPVGPAGARHPRGVPRHALPLRLDAPALERAGRARSARLPADRCRCGDRRGRRTLARERRSVEDRGPRRHREREPGARERPTPQPIAIGTLSSMFSGFLRAHDAVRLGLLDADDPSLEALGAMFAGPDPWCPFFF